MPFGLVSGVGRGMGVLDGMEIVEGEVVVLGVNMGHPIVARSYSLPWGLRRDCSQITLRFRLFTCTCGRLYGRICFA